MRSKQSIENLVNNLASKNAAADCRTGNLEDLKKTVARAKNMTDGETTPTVFILTYCRNPELFYGTELIFKTLRIGFPTANVVVVDNASIAEARTRIKSLAEENGCLFEQISTHSIQHHEFIYNTIFASADESMSGPLVFLDPDICFWDSCEDFAFDGLIAGRLIGRFDDGITKTHTMPRLHSSFLWITDTQALREEIRKIKIKTFDFEPFASFSFVLDGTWYRYNTGAGLYAALRHRISHFDVEHLDRYDHIFGGSHIDWLSPHYDSKTREKILEIHRHAKEGNLQALKGLWRYQIRGSRDRDRDGKDSKKEKLKV